MNSKPCSFPILKEFHDYFIKQWCYNNGEWSRFHKWQVYQTPIGAGSTNNSVESINKQIKSVYKYKRS